MDDEVEKGARPGSPYGGKNMARPHENTTLTTICANPECRKVVSTEYPFSEGLVVEEAGRRPVRHGHAAGGSSAVAARSG